MHSGCLVVLGAVAAIVVFAGWRFKQAIELMWLSEQFLHAQLLACDLVGDFIERNPEHRWPRSWEELDALPARNEGMYRWPEDATTIKTIIIIDFDASLDEIVRQSDESFTAIRCNHPRLQPSNYGFVGWLKSGAYLTPKAEQTDKGPNS